MMITIVNLLKTNINMKSNIERLFGAVKKVDVFVTEF